MATKTFALEYTLAENANASVGVVIVAAGSATRMGGINKILASIDGESVIWHTINAFNSNPLIGKIVVVTREDMIPDLQNIVDVSAFLKVSDIIKGGTCREESVKKGFEMLTKNQNIKTVLIHDGARPLISDEVINRVVSGVEEFSAVVPAVKAKDTMKKIGALGKIEQTVSNLSNIQTPQGFSVEIFKTALEKAGDKLDIFTDDASIVEAANIPVYSVMGDYKNIKITTPEDMVLAKAYLKLIKGEM